MMPRKAAGKEQGPDLYKATFNAILELPGLYPEELQRILKLPLKDIERVLKEFEEDHLVVVRLEAGKKQYFPLHAMGAKDRNLLAAIRDKVTAKMLRFLLDHPHSTVEELEQHLRLSRAKVNAHIERLFKFGVLVLARDTHKGNKTTYSIFDPLKIEAILRAKDRSLCSIFMGE